MGQSLNPFVTHEVVPEDVRGAISPVNYTPAAPELYEQGCSECPVCGSSYGWWTYSTNCDWCGRQFCQRCCPKRYLLHDKPGCPECTRKAFQLKRAAMLRQHYATAGVERVPHETTTLCAQQATSPS